MSLTSSNLVGYLRAEFAKASRLRVWLFFLQLIAAVPAAAAVLVPDRYDDILYMLALAGAALLLIWWLINGRYLRVREAAQAARRAALLLGGLGASLSPSEVQVLRERFTSSAAEAKAQEKEDYYATTLASGTDRLAEMLEESAFYSEHLQRCSARIMLCVVVFFALIFLVLGLGVFPNAAHDTAYSAVRVFLSMLVFVMSADVAGAFFAHRSAASSIRDIRQRLITADSAGYPEADVMLAFVDYNAAVEGAPENVPFTYKVYGEHLNERWADYQRDRTERRASGS